MVRIVAVSDTHGRLSPLERVAERVRDCDLLVHLGDGVAEAHELQLFYPDRRIVCVRGNGDWSSAEPETKELIIGGKRLFLCHGHTLSGRGKTGRRTSSCSAIPTRPFSMWRTG